MLHYLQIGGPLMWVILIIGLVAFGVFVERALHLHRARIRHEDFLHGIFNILRRGNHKEAIALCSQAPGPVAHLTRTAIENRGDRAPDLHQKLVERGAAELARMRRRLAVISTVAHVAPLLGLLGTILKMVEGLGHIRTQFPLVQNADVLGPLLDALVITAAGISVAVPCYVAFSFLAVRIERLALDMESTVFRLEDFMRDQDSATSGEPETTT
tara:strand:+ start:2242 stop:2883 length:642 start_codon:yes stop_codon:yes gene_type:complete